MAEIIGKIKKGRGFFACTLQQDTYKVRKRNFKPPVKCIDGKIWVYYPCRGD